MVPSRRWLQFSLKSFLVVVSALAVGLGWKVERARERGRAIDAIVALGGTVQYDNLALKLTPSLLNEFNVNHFWIDLKGFPVSIVLGGDIRLDSASGSMLADIYGLKRIDIFDTCGDADLRHLYGVDDECEIALQSAKVSHEAVCELKRKLPRAKITYFVRGLKRCDPS